MPWLSLSLASVSLKLNWEVSRARPVRPTSLSRRLNAASRSSSSNKMRITRIKTACLSLLTNFNRRSKLTRSKLKRLKKLLHSTWPSSARLNKTLRKLRKGAKWPELNSALPTKHILGHNATNIMRTASFHPIAQVTILEMFLNNIFVAIVQITNLLLRLHAHGFLNQQEVRHWSH